MVIKKSLRKGGRYVLFKQHYNKGDKPKNEKDIQSDLKKYIGLIDMPPIKFVFLNHEYGIIKTNNIGLKKVIIGLILCSNKENRIEILDSSGTIKSIKERNKNIKIN